MPGEAAADVSGQREGGSRLVKRAPARVSALASRTGLGHSTVVGPPGQPRGEFPQVAGVPDVAVAMPGFDRQRNRVEAFLVDVP